MGQRFLLDTNIVIELLRDNIPAARKNELVSIIMIETNISIITKIETLGWLPPDKNEENLIIAFIADCTVFNLTDDIVDKTIELRKTYKKLALPDAIIAATALIHNLTLVSRNDADFQRIKKLKYSNPFNI